ncbi:MAG TPA: prepilin peptidase, partial [Actinomycetota bacterium]|nr:prepilin peptidase [Actinomycetota bacterium]
MPRGQHRLYRRARETRDGADRTLGSHAAVGAKAILTLAAFVLLGLVFGSFGTVAAHRIPLRESIVSGRSRCPHCRET